MKLYPLKFVPRFVPKMWGGRKLQELLHKPLPPETPIGESWEIFDFPPGATGPDALQATDDPTGWVSATVANGSLRGKTLHDLVLTDGRLLLGESQPVDTAHGPQFPLLIKFLDARDDLSVQVHPPTEYAARHVNAFVKNEAWYIFHREERARLLLGAKPGVKRAQFEQALQAGDADQLMNSVPVRAGEAYYLPSGTLHALGGGIVAYEVQTPSDTTYRVFDFNRVDPSTGKPRTLHVQQALDCIQFDFDALKNRTPMHAGDAVLARAPQWVLMQADLGGADTYRLEHPTGPIILTALTGGGAVSSGGVQESFAAGQTILLPPAAETRLSPGANTRVLLAAVPPLEVDQLRPR